MVFQAIRSHEEDIPLREAVERKGYECHDIAQLQRQEPVRKLHSERGGKQDHPGSDHGSAGESPARGILPVEQDVDPVQQDAGDQRTSHRRKDRIPGQVKIRIAADGIIILIAGPLVLFVDPQKDHHADQCGEQDMGFAQRIKSPVIQDHARNNIDRAGLLDPLLHITAHHLCCPRVLSPIPRHKGYSIQQYKGKADAGNDRNRQVDLSEPAPVLLHPLLGSGICRKHPSLLVGNLLALITALVRLHRYIKDRLHRILVAFHPFPE